MKFTFQQYLELLLRYEPQMPADQAKREYRMYLMEAR